MSTEPQGRVVAYPGPSGWEQEQPLNQDRPQQIPPPPSAPLTGWQSPAAPTGAGAIPPPPKEPPPGWDPAKRQIPTRPATAVRPPPPPLAEPAEKTGSASGQRRPTEPRADEAVASELAVPLPAQGSRSARLARRIYSAQVGGLREMEWSERARQMALPLLVYAVIVTLTVAAINAWQNIHRPPAQVVTSQSGVPADYAFPRTAASSLAVQFTAVYLDTSRSADERKAQLATLTVASPDDPTYGYPAGGKEPGVAVLGAYVAGYQQLDPKTSRVIVVATLAPSLRRVVLAVKVRQDPASGNLAVAAPPAFVSAPAPGQMAPLGGDANSGLDSSMQPALKVLFTAYGAGDQATLQSVGVSGGSVRGGLGGAVTLVAIAPVKVLSCDGAQTDCTLNVSVTWQMDRQGTFVQPYRAHMRSVDAAWRVVSLDAI